ncbi:hypothetical protein MRB53_021289 [Persea americana]|uniref:Uncharacterized protein n=1 Tax=Persea americana TaxID=3435 RepID=A0ACC2L3P9_PERAE|nr:hypothetical protein MRB53_021289 [Persea americana]
MYPSQYIRYPNTGISFLYSKLHLPTKLRKTDTNQSNRCFPFLFNGGSGGGSSALYTAGFLSLVAFFVLNDWKNEINVEEDEIDESYAPDKDDDFVEYNYDGMELEDENWEFENDFISGPKVWVMSSDSDGISYHRYHEFDPNMQMDWPALSIGLSFKDVNMLRMVLRQYAIRNSFNINYLKNDKTRLTAVCSDQTCNWRLHASVLQDGQTFEIRKLIDSHNCLNINQGENHMASAAWLAEKIEARIKMDVTVTPKVLCAEIFRCYGVTVSYLKMWRAKETALQKIRGSFEESFRFIPSMCKTIVKYNPESIARYQLEENGSFKRVFVAYSASIKGFLNGCRPFIGLDGTFLKGKHKGVLLTAVAIDGNKQLFPLAIAVVEAENIDSWLFFLHWLKIGLNGSEFTFMSDRQKGLVEAVNRVFPMGYQRFCMRHVYANFQKYYKGRLCPQARQWIENIPGVHWSRAYFPEWLPCNYNQNNFTESFNKMIMDSRGLPICDMIDWIRQKMMVNLQSRRSRSERWDGIVCPKIKKILNDVRDQSRFCDLFFAGGDEYEMVAHAETHSSEDISQFVFKCTTFEKPKVTYQSYIFVQLELL